MKTSLRSLLFTALLGMSALKISAQCVVSNIIIQNVRVAGVQAAGSCTVTFDASFNIENNNGNKFIFIHAWTEADYPDYFHCVDGTSSKGAVKAPDATVLANAFLNIGIDNSDTIPTIITDYLPDPSVTLTTVASIQKEVLPDGSVNIILKGITTTLPVTCGTPTVIIADLWSSQAAQAQVAHCVNCGIRFAAGFLSTAGFINCNHAFNVVLTNNTAAALNGYYRVYVDVNNDSYFTPAIDTLIIDTTHFTVAASSTTPVTGNIPAANSSQNIFLVITLTDGDGTGASTVVFLPAAQCAPLPVTFRTFTANRTNQSNVILKWETSIETNSNGFALQRNVDNKTWQTVAFVRSQTKDGNSNSPLTYAYNDLNATTGISQYRVLQVDLDGKNRLSEIRAVRGLGQKGKTIVYPNPSFDGRVNVVFEDKEGSRDVMLADMNGRVIKQWKNISGNTIQVDNLQPGIYSMRIVVLETGEQSVEKIVVSRR
ncbi:MAG TPA: T9SS type A sorting domain-containing protein [Chitinophagaceae bacterium]|nr:T9SS type A sorting domain-containing protein [Chitinophagaceae bacterium]